MAIKTTRSIFHRWFLLPVILVSFHSSVVLWAGWAVSSSADAETGFVWLIPYYLDYPASLLMHTFGMSLDQGAPILAAFFYVLGLFYWSLVASLVQVLWRSFSPRNRGLG
jgi:hypothetical protein